MEHQDWETYIIHCKDPKKEKEKKNDTVKKGNFVNKSKKLDQKIEEGDLKHKKIDPELSKKIQQGRLSKGLTQKQLATKLSIPRKSNKSLFTKNQNKFLKHQIQD